ncbi:MAG: N-6 DNA methylase [Candidatus Bathyarchaeia archaeon]
MMNEETPKVEFLPADKIRCYITGKLRRDTPEEQVRQRVARSLVEEYGYPKEDIEIEFPIKVKWSRPRKRKPRADVVVFLHGKPHTQENIFLICETKREEIKPTDPENGVDTLNDYLSVCPNARFGVWVGSEVQVLERVEEKGIVRFEPVADIPPYGKKEPSRLTFDQLIPAREGLREIFRRCHNYIYANQGLQKEAAFHELLKLIFCKVYDEQTTPGEMRFDISPEERRLTIAQKRLRQRIDELFEEVKDRFPYIFRKDERIQLNDRVLAYIVSELRRYSLLLTEADIKGAAYEEIVGPNLRGDRGEFFTPRNVCEMAVRMVFAIYPKERWLSLKVIDPACGTGGFLVAVKNLWRSLLEEQAKRRYSNQVQAKEWMYRRLQEICRDRLFGIDINPALVRACQMNLIMHGGEAEDGAPNVFAANSLLPPSEWPEEMRQKIRLGTFDVVLTNPPFGAGPGLVVDDPHILAQFEIRYIPAEVRKPRSKGGPHPKPVERSGVPPEQLFIERCWQFLKPGGVMAIVLPDSILSNPGLLYIRRWILKRCRVFASISLPTETFEAFGGTGTKTSVLVLQKKTQEQMRLEEESGQMEDYEVFMAICQTMGYDRRGNDLWLRTPEGEIVMREVVTHIVTRTPEGLVIHEPKKEMLPVRDDDVAQVAPLFERWINERRALKGGSRA